MTKKYSGCMKLKEKRVMVTKGLGWIKKVKELTFVVCSFELIGVIGNSLHCCDLVFKSKAKFYTFDFQDRQINSQDKYKIKHKISSQDEINTQ